ncbi:hypothetical protein [Nostoc sp.]
MFSLFAIADTALAKMATSLPTLERANNADFSPAMLWKLCKN